MDGGGRSIVVVVVVFSGSNMTPPLGGLGGAIKEKSDEFAVARAGALQNSFLLDWLDSNS